MTPPRTGCLIGVISAARSADSIDLARLAADNACPKRSAQLTITHMATRSTPRYLTKSRFKLAVECPTKLFYTGKPEYANTNNEDAFLAMLADGGFQVGELAKFMYPEGV